MDIGMLWYDDDSKRPFNEKVARAVDYYKAKYGSVPTVCFVNPATLKDAPDAAGGVQIRSARKVMLDHFWLGVGETNGNGDGIDDGKGRRPARRAGRSAAGPARSGGRLRAPAVAGRAG